jgi:hypothetical protein
MRRVSKLWMAAVVGALLLGTLVGVVSARPGERPLAAGGTRKLTLTGADFIPRYSDFGWENYGNYVTTGGGSAFFAAPVVFPCLSPVVVERIKLHAVDQNEHGWYSLVYLMRVKPANGNTATLGWAQSSYSSSTRPTTFTSAEINKVVRPNQRAYLMLKIEDSAIKVYGVTIEYHIRS